MEKSKNKGWSVVAAGVAINLSLGVLYTWSIFKQEIKESIVANDGRFTWDIGSLNDPFSVCCLMFTLAMIVAGRLQDAFSPRVTAVMGGILTGAGLILVSFSSALSIWILGFGVLTGLGVGFGYASATPPALKWFPAKKTGMIAGIVVAGFGLAAVYIAPLSTYLITQFGLSKAMFVFGVAFIMVVCLSSIFLVNPPGHYSAEKTISEQYCSVNSLNTGNEFSPSSMVRTTAFYYLWIMYFIGAGSALIIIGGVAGMAKQSMGDLSWLVVVLMAIGNAGGRVIAGVVSDKVGRMKTLAMIFFIQGAVILSLLYIDQGNAFLLVSVATVIGFNYGTNLSLFPSVTKDFFGMKNFGMNYGLLFSAWGVGGFLFPRIAQMFLAATGSQQSSLILCCGLLWVSGILSFLIVPPGLQTVQTTNKQYCEGSAKLEL